MIYQALKNSVALGNNTRSGPGTQLVSLLIQCCFALAQAFAEKGIVLPLEKGSMF